MPRPRAQRHTRFGGPHLEHMRVRRELLDLVLDIAEKDHLNHTALSHMFGITQPRASLLLHRRLEKFNSETLIDMLARLGVRVQLTPVSRDPYRRWNFARGSR